MGCHGNFPRLIPVESSVEGKMRMIAESRLMKNCEEETFTEESNRVSKFNQNEDEEKIKKREYLENISELSPPL